MRAAIADAREAARGHEAVIVSHQLPVWIARRSFEEKSTSCTTRASGSARLASLTSLTFDDDHFDGFTYSEPAGHLLPEELKSGKKFVGGA